jgi:arsenate reductase
MDERRASHILSGLANEHRLRALRTMVRAGPPGVAAGELAARIGLSPSGLSFHLKELESAGLVRSRRAGRNIFYAAELGVVDALAAFLSADCCAGLPALATPAAPADEDFAMPTPPYDVLVLCTGNSARSIMGEVLVTELGRPNFRGLSAGSRPKGEPHPLAIETLKAHGHPVEGLRSKSWDEFAVPGAPEIDFVFTVCDSAANEECPVWPGHPLTAHWGIPDPAAATGSKVEQLRAFEAAYRMLRRRIEVFVALPIVSLEKHALRDRMRRIHAEAQASEQRS